MAKVVAKKGMPKKAPMHKMAGGMMMSEKEMAAMMGKKPKPKPKKK